MSSELSSLYVFAPVSGRSELAGRLDWRPDAGTFTYAPAWLESQQAYALDPRNLPRAPGPQTALGRPEVHGVFLDAGPDAWGRRLIERERGVAALDNPLEMLRLTNGCGTGALMFSQSRTRPSPIRRVMALATLEELEATSQAIAAGERVEQSALKLIFEHGSSLGGARPKASVVREDGEWIAKFSQPDDPLDIPQLEWACLRLARLAGISVPDHELVHLNGRSALLVCRFDRNAEGAIHYLSLHSLLAMQRVGPADVIAPGGIYSYSGAATLYRRAGVPDPGRRFFERMMFNVLIGNTDDHARNHGLLYRNGLWDMAPAFDLVAYGASRHSLGIGRAGREASIANALDAADCFDLGSADGERILGRLQAVVSQAPAILAEAGMRGGDIDMALARMRH